MFESHLCHQAILLLINSFSHTQRHWFSFRMPVEGERYFQSRLLLRIASLQYGRGSMADKTSNTDPGQCLAETSPTHFVEICLSYSQLQRRHHVVQRQADNLQGEFFHPILYQNHKV